MIITIVQFFFYFQIIQSYIYIYIYIYTYIYELIVSRMFTLIYLRFECKLV